MTRGYIEPGTRFGRLIVSRRSGTDAGGMALWLCKCDCGNEATIRGPFLRKGQAYCSKQCLIYRETIRRDVAGQKFGLLTALEFVCISPKSRKAIWRFGCDCGASYEREIDAVLSGNTTSCGCVGIKSRIKHGLSQTRAYHRDAHKKWVGRNPGKAAANRDKRRDGFLLRVPKWLTAIDRSEINEIYREAARLSRETGVAHHVDHVIPLRGRTVSGLHVPANLQVLPAHANLQKSRRLPDDVC